MIFYILYMYLIFYMHILYVFYLIFYFIFTYSNGMKTIMTFKKPPSIFCKLSPNKWMDFYLLLRDFFSKSRSK